MSSHFVIMACNTPRTSYDPRIQAAMKLRDLTIEVADENGFFDDLGYCWGVTGMAAYLRFTFRFPESSGPLGRPGKDRRWTSWRPVGRSPYPYGLRVWTVCRGRWRNVLAISWGANGTALHHVTPGLWQRDLRRLAAAGRSTNADRAWWSQKGQFRPTRPFARVSA